MKKSLFFVAAASALMLTACSSENDVVQNATQPQTTVQQKAVGFDVYTPAATGVTRAGLEGTMTTSRLQREDGGFGVYAYLTEDANYYAGTSETSANATSYSPSAGQKPNFMVNEKILWNNTNLGWYYNPLKYWPNETDHDSQSTNATMENGTNPVHLDRLTFFAYAPYVATGVDEPGITAISDKEGKLGSTAVTDPTVAWKGYSTPSTDLILEDGVDLLWGVAPSGGLSYTAVNGWNVTRAEGKPLIDMIKPNVNTSMKFLFNHALARFGLTVVAAVDQVSPGGTPDPNTKITISSVKISGPFGNVGELNLNNRDYANIAYWTKIREEAISDIHTHTGSGATELLLTGTTANSAIAPHLRYAGSHSFEGYSPQDVVGVTTAKQDLLRPSKQWLSKLSSAPAYNPAKVYYTDEAGTSPAVAKYTTTKKGEVYTYDDTEKKYVAVESGTPINASVYPHYNKDGEANYYTVAETESFNGNHLLGYSFSSYLNAGASGDPVATGKVEVVSTTGSSTTVKVTENSVTGFVGNLYLVESTTFNTSTIYELKNTDGSTTGIWVKLSEITYGYSASDLSGKKLYKVNGTGTAADPTWYEYTSSPSWSSGSTDIYVTLSGSKINENTLDYKYDASGTYYEAERNYIYVVPTNILKERNAALAGTDAEKKLRTITLQIEYYITTEDNKVAGGRTQTRNVITKDVLLPSLANGKSYNLNLVLGLTSVKVEAEVSDWKVENVQADLPQNTAE